MCMATPSPFADHDHISAKAQVVKENKSGVTKKRNPASERGIPFKLVKMLVSSFEI